MTVDIDALARIECDRLADLLDEHAETIGRFAEDPVRAVRLVAVLLRMPFGREVS